MLIAIASDIHDHLPNLQKFLDFIKREGVKTLILCGDTGNQKTLDFINKNFEGKIYAVLGNLDDEKFSLSKKKLSFFRALKIGGIKIAITHFPDEARKLALTEKYDFVFYGHTHKPWLEKISGCFSANPGNLTGIWYKPSFAVLDSETKKLSLKILEKI